MPAQENNRCTNVSMCELVRADETMGLAILFLLINYGRFAVIAVIRIERMPKIECEQTEIPPRKSKVSFVFLLFFPFVNNVDWIFRINRMNIQMKSVCYP